MKKKKVALMRNFDLWSDNFIKIDKEGEHYYFEIGNHITTDLAEAVAIIMKYKSKSDSKFWDLAIEEIDYYNITPEKSLYWLSGGEIEWKIMSNYKKTWIDSSLLYQEEFGMRVISILKKSKTMNDVRNGFLKYLNLPILYEFALENEIA
jgi:hypothetical protein